MFESPPLGKGAKDHCPDLSRCIYSGKTSVPTVGAGLAPPGGTVSVHAFARAQSKNVGSPARADEGIGPYGF